MTKMSELIEIFDDMYELDRGDEATDYADKMLQELKEYDLFKTFQWRYNGCTEY